MHDLTEAFRKFSVSCAQASLAFGIFANAVKEADIRTRADA